MSWCTFTINYTYLTGLLEYIDLLYFSSKSEAYVQIDSLNLNTFMHWASNMAQEYAINQPLACIFFLK